MSSQSTSLSELVAFVAQCQPPNGKRLRFAASWCQKLVVESAHIVDEGQTLFPKACCSCYSCVVTVV